MAKLNELKGKPASTMSGPDADKLSHGIEADAAESKSWVLPLLHPDGTGSPKSTVESWNNLPWDAKFQAIQRVTMRGNKPSILEEKLARDAIFERFNELKSKLSTDGSSVSRQDWFNIQIASRDLKIVEEKRKKEIAQLKAGFWGKTFHVIGKVFWPLKFAWRMIRAVGRRTGYWLLRKTDASALTPQTRLMLYDRDREVTFIGKAARALGGNPAGWIGRKQPQGNAMGSVGKAWRFVTMKSAREARQSSKVAPS